MDGSRRSALDFAQCRGVTQLDTKLLLCSMSAGAVAWLARPGDQAAHAQLWCAGYFMMGLVLLGLLGLTTTLFKAAGSFLI